MKNKQRKAAYKDTSRAIEALKDKIRQLQRDASMSGMITDVSGAEQLAKLGIAIMKNYDIGKEIYKLGEIEKIRKELSDKREELEQKGYGKELVVQGLNDHYNANPISKHFGDSIVVKKFFSDLETKVNEKNGMPLTTDEIIDVEVYDVKPHELGNDIKEYLTKKVNDGTLDSDDATKLIEHKVIDVNDVTNTQMNTDSSEATESSKEDKEVKFFDERTPLENNNSSHDNVAMQQR